MTADTPGQQVIDETGIKTSLTNAAIDLDVRLGLADAVTLEVTGIVTHSGISWTENGGPRHDQKIRVQSIKVKNHQAALIPIEDGTGLAAVADLPRGTDFD